MTITYTLWSVDFFVSFLSFGIVGGRVIWILGKYLAEEEGAGRKASNSVKDVRQAFTMVLLAFLALQTIFFELMFSVSLP